MEPLLILLEQGLRYKKHYSKSQDSYSLNYYDEFRLFGVYDGHGTNGHIVSKIVSEELPFLVHNSIKNIYSPSQIKKNIIEVFTNYANNKLKNDVFYGSGSTVVLAIDYKYIDVVLFVVCGDAVGIWKDVETSRANITKESKPADRDEKKRLNNLGVDIYYGRIAGLINVSRSIGDFDFQKYNRNNKDFVVSPIPIFKFVSKYDMKDLRYIIGSDGIVEDSRTRDRYITSTDLVNIMSLKKEETEKKFRVQILDKQNSTDDITLLLIDTKISQNINSLKDIQILKEKHDPKNFINDTEVCLSFLSKRLGIKINKLVEILLSKLI